MGYTERERDESGRNTAMPVGVRIKRVGNFGGITMKEWGLAVGFDEKRPDVRIAKNKNNSGNPKKEMMRKMAPALE